MLKKEINILIVGSILMMYSCKSERNVIVSDIYYDYKCQNFDSYKIMYNQINDSIKIWTLDTLGRAAKLFGHEWQLDSVILFNNDSSRLFTMVNNRMIGWKDSEVDYIYEFGGAYIEDEWYYYFLPTSTLISRTKYKDGLYTPYTFDELSYIAHKSKFGSMLKRAKDGSILLNEKSFNKKFFDLESGKSYEIEKAYRDLKLIEKKHHENARGKLKPERIEEIKAKMEASEKPLEPSKDNKKVETEEVKIFESEAWKNRYKKRKSKK